MRLAGLKVHTNIISSIAAPVRVGEICQDYLK